MSISSHYACREQPQTHVIAGVPALTQPMQTPPSRRDRSVQVSLTNAEHERITQYARQTGLSRAAYLRGAGLGNDMDRKIREEFIRALLELIGELEQMDRTDARQQLLNLLRHAADNTQQT